MMFSQMSHYEIAEEDMSMPLTNIFGDRPSHTLQTLPMMNLYSLVNPDDYERISVDPAYRIERLTKAHEAFKRLCHVEDRVG